LLARDAEVAARKLTELRARGVRIAIDDFGTGYSSLAYLRQFPVDALKIDRSFISSIGSSGESRALIHTLVQLAKTLGLETVGEGIEEHTQLRHLQGEHCDQGQGFLLARPLEPGAIDELLQALAEDRFLLYGRPIVDLRTGVVTHRELLIRMLSDDGDSIPRRPSAR
jgi:diguanylate cyclase